MVLANETLNNCDYPLTFGDYFLESVKKAIPNPEIRHNLLPSLAKYQNYAKFLKYNEGDLDVTLKFQDKSVPIIMQSPIMLAAGGNKTGQNLPYFHSLGFGGVTVGSATQFPHAGNTHRPRMNMLPHNKAIQNSMGLNNPGIDAIARSVDMALGKAHKEKLSLGISVADTPGLTKNDEKIKDILVSFRKAYRAADYVEINVSCPNTGEGRIDWQNDFLDTLLKEVMNIRRNLAPRKAVFVKLSPDFSQSSLEKTLDVISQSGVTGLVLFNTFPADRIKYLNMDSFESEAIALTKDGKKGGISGSILFKNTLPAVRFIKKQLPTLSVIAVGGVDHGAKVLDLLEAGADAVQCYSVLAYRWNAVNRMNKELAMAVEAKGHKTLSYLYT